MRNPSEAESQFNNSEDRSKEALESVQAMLRSASSSRPFFPPTLLYNEGWLLRLILDWFARRSVEGHPLSFATDATWFSEALLPSAFLARHRGDKLAESWTHADGVVGHFLIGEEGKADLKLLPKAKQFLVLEAKMFSSLSSGVSNAGYFDQAARSVACMAEALSRAGQHPSKIVNFGFCVLAPISQVEQGVFAKRMDRKSLVDKVWRRVEAYGGEKNEWFRQWFRPTWELIDIQCLSWEGIIAAIEERDPSTGEAIALFYDYCLRFNQ